MTSTVASDVHERILTAAEQCFDRYGLAKTTMEDIARAAEVGRATVYRYFSGGRDEIVLAVLFRDFQRLLPRLVRILADAPSMADAVVDTFLESLTFIRDESRPDLMIFVQSMFRPTGPGVASQHLESTPRAVSAMLVEAARPQFEQAQAARLVRDGVTLDDAVEFLTRMLISMLAIPSHIERTDTQLRQFIRTYIAAALFHDEPAHTPR